LIEVTPPALLTPGAAPPAAAGAVLGTLPSRSAFPHPKADAARIAAAAKCTPSLCPMR